MLLEKLKGWLSSVAPALSIVLVGTCVLSSLTGYEATEYIIQEVVEAAVAEEETEEEEETVKGNFDLDDGYYEGTGTGYSGDIDVGVTIAAKQITQIDILAESDDDTYFMHAETVIDSIIEAQSLDVDTVSGATYSSRGIINAVKNALYGTVDENEVADQEDTALGSTSVSTVEDAAAYNDGTYYGTATGFSGSITVKVVIKDGKIYSITVTDYVDDEAYFSKAKTLISKIISGQTTNVDTVSGATYSSVGIINAVRNALAKAAVSGTSEEEEEVTVEVQSTGLGSTSVSTAEDASAYNDGTYYGTATGFSGDITVKVVIKNGVIHSITVTDYVDDEAYFSKAKTLIDDIISGQTTNVDTVSGATYSSVGIINAVRKALAKAAVEEVTVDDSATAESEDRTVEAGTSGNFPYPDGTYYGSGEGWGGEDSITVAVTIKDQTITAVEVVSAEDETEEYFSAASVLLDEIVTAQSTDLDTVSGATYSSNGILEAVNAALAAAAEAADADTDSDSEEDGSSSGSDTGSDDDSDSGSDDDSDSGSDSDEDSSDGDDSTDDTDTEKETTSYTYADGTYSVKVTVDPYDSSYIDDYEDEADAFSAYTLTVKVTIANDTVTAITFSGANSTNKSYCNRAQSGILKKVAALTGESLTTSAVEGLDTVSGATCSSVAIKAAIVSALEQAAAAQSSSASVSSLTYSDAKTEEPYEPAA